MRRKAFLSICFVMAAAVYFLTKNGEAVDTTSVHALSLKTIDGQEDWPERMAEGSWVTDRDPNTDWAWD